MRLVSLKRAKTYKNRKEYLSKNGRRKEVRKEHQCMKEVKAVEPEMWEGPRVKDDSFGEIQQKEGP